MCICMYIYIYIHIKQAANLAALALNIQVWVEYAQYSYTLVNWLKRRNVSSFVLDT